MKVLAIIFSVLILAACSGGESGTGVQDDTVVGPVNGFGSVIVAGIKFDTNNTTISIEGNTVSESNLNVGMIVKVKGQINGTTGTATSISMEYELKGLVLSTNIDADGVGDMNVMGQTVNVDSDTQFESEIGSITTIDQVSNLSVVKVSGYSNGQGEVFATFVKVFENDGEADELKVKGQVANLGASAFDIGGITITFDGNTEFEDMSSGDLQNGLFVEVESDSGAFSGGTTFYAEEISTLDFDEDEGSEIEIEGVVTNDSNVGSGQFELSGRVIKFDGNTEFEGGNQSDIQNDVKLEVDGSVLSDGSIMADEIEFRVSSSIEMTGYVESTTSDSVVIMGQNITVNALTAFEDNFDEENRDFNLADISANDYLSLTVYVDPDTSNLTANSIEKDEDQGEMQESAVEATVATIEGNGDLRLSGMPSLLVDLNTNNLTYSGNVGGEVEVSGDYDEGTTTLIATDL